MSLQTVESWARIAVLLLSIATVTGIAQLAAQTQNRAQATQAGGFWTDPATGLMWAAKDNGKDVSCKDAMKYCHELRLGGTLTGD